MGHLRSAASIASRTRVATRRDADALYRGGESRWPPPRHPNCHPNRASLPNLPPRRRKSHPSPQISTCPRRSQAVIRHRLPPASRSAGRPVGRSAGRRHEFSLRGRPAIDRDPPTPQLARRLIPPIAPMPNGSSRQARNATKPSGGASVGINHTGSTISNLGSDAQ